MASKEPEQAAVGKGLSFVHDSWAELKKVQSPSRSEIRQATIVVFMMICAFAIILGIIDLFWGALMKFLLANG